MRSKLLGLLALTSVFYFSQTAFAKTSPDVLAKIAISKDPKESAQAIAELRALGPAGLEALLRVHRKEIQAQVATPLLAGTNAWQHLSAALDTVSQQKNSYLSGLYWYTDFVQAKEAARASGKPILSLRLLGKLSEEFSCANSRFFRTVLYSNTEVSKALRERFILHWASVRPAPRVTIDFGDGRKLERTLTGNSIHYVLNTDGSPIDALPGLYGPRAFLRSLTQIEDVFKQLNKENSASPPAYVLSSHHRSRVTAINLGWVSDIQRIGGKIPEDVNVVRDQDGTPTAVEITSLAITKAMTEKTILMNLTAGAERLVKVMDEAAWRKIAKLHMADARLDAQSIGLIQRQTHKALSADAAKKSSEAALRDLVEKLEMHIALDTVRNEYMLHTKLHAWLIADRLLPRDLDLDEFNSKVYAELFLTPASDPWLGLFESSTYVALENGGIVR